MEKEKEFDNEEFVETVDCKKNRVHNQHLKWDNKFNIGHILTFFAIIIAAIGLIFQKRDLDSKINDLNHVVQKLESEKFERELQDMYGSTEMYNYFTYSHGYTIDRITEIGTIYDSELTFLLSEINEILGLFLKHNKLSPEDKEKLELLQRRNVLKSYIFLQSINYRNSITNFTEKNSPKKENYSNSDDYIRDIRVYTDKLTLYVDSMKLITDSLALEPIMELKKIENKYINR